MSEIARKQTFAPFGFMSNGLHTYFWDVELAHPRMVAGFFTLADLERLHFIRANHTPLSTFRLITQSSIAVTNTKPSDASPRREFDLAATVPREAPW